MKKITTLILLALFLLACKETPKKIKEDQTEWKILLDKDLSKWDNYLSFKHQLGYDGKPPTDSLNNPITPIGLNNPNYDVFSIVMDGENPMVKVSGEYYGCLVTKEEFANYHFQLKFRWGNTKLVPREHLLKDSGILYHSIGPHGAEHWRSWMLSQEFQIMEGHTGDYWRQATSAIDIRAYTSESILNPMAHESQDFIPVGMNEENELYCLRSNNYEKAHGEWNTLDLICFEDKVLHIVNGEVVMILKNSRYIDANGNKVPLTKGKIQLQSEAAEVFFKDIKIKPLNNLSEAHSVYFKNKA